MSIFCFLVALFIISIEIVALPAIGFTIKDLLNLTHDGAYDTVMGNFFLLNMMCLLITGY